jgi:hypothetical protein
LITKAGAGCVSSARPDLRRGSRVIAIPTPTILFRCWKDGAAYDESKYLATLARRGAAINVAAVEKAL